ncbi:phage tail assembly chaperone [Pseudomonas syringae]|uniref:phage tail assembly chaperone n=1 Tax=Pseudomonas syringae TaxID=317 RepID=UPI00389AD9FA
MRPAAVFVTSAWPFAACVIARLTKWKKYRIALNRIPAQPGYFDVIDWPVMPV